MVRRRSVPGFGDCLSSAHGVSWPNRQANRLILADTARRIKKARGDHAHGAVVMSDCIPAAKLGSNAMSMPLLSIPGGISRAVVTGQGMGESTNDGRPLYTLPECSGIVLHPRIFVLDSQGSRVASKDEDLRMPLTIFGAETGKDPDKEDSW
ncbi:hypothetical protein CTAM01_02071 [Colletotrichum tamarilloi]|uniref:Uncharacterized protein n=1 Tax=Colletotrichum tamarilloi TaxID=1209934 RepID=A0ABQ9RRK2_9PEZI|nr:uncharacterized protein CTAM01_02071 [Colletotrichum tamarilloi]KAK1509948.1 hypothetical protein CTAM01_02071 [Colletotrichum tamarilloi]